jgi:hypothetical protein
VCGLPAQTFTFTMPGKRSGPPHAVTGVDVVAQFGDKTYLATVTVQTTAADNPTYVRDCHDNPQRIPGAAARRGQPLLSRRIPARWRRGAVGGGHGPGAPQSTVALPVRRPAHSKRLEGQPVPRRNANAGERPQPRRYRASSAPPRG